MSAKAFVQIINNPAKPRTSLRSASELVARGVLRWVTFPHTAFVVPFEERRRAQQKRIGNREYFRDNWSKTYVRATEKQPEWMPAQLGYGVMGMVPTRARAE